MRSCILLCGLFLTLNCLGQVSFTTDTQSIPQSGPTVTGDFNRDGWPDLAVVDESDGALYVYFGIGNKNFNLAVVVGGAPSGVTSMRTADMNGDGILDLVISNGTTAVTIMYGTASGSFTSGTTVSFGTTVNSVEIGDLNGDGKVDMVGANKIKLNQGNGTFKTSSQTLTLKYPSWMGLADVNRDGKLDIVGMGAKGIGIWRGKGDGTFQVPTTYLTLPVHCSSTSGCFDETDGFAIGDFYNSGNLDIVWMQDHYKNDDTDLLNPASTIYTFKNNGSGSFTRAHSVNVKYGADTIIAADLNGDQKQDLLFSFGNTRGPNGYFLLGNGNGTFSATPQPAPWGMEDAYLSFTRDLGLTSRQDVISYIGPFLGPDTGIFSNTTPVTNCAPPNSSKLAARICSPLNGSKTATTSVTIRASGNSPAGVQRLEISIDGVKRADGWSDQIVKTYTLTAGNHRVAVVAVDMYKGTASTSANITVP
jgi:hypothetical protein